MVATPQVRDLNGLVDTLKAGATDQFNQINSDIAANDTAGQAQIAGLDAKKTRAFGDIEQGAQNKGMFFSGFSPDSQARYTADTYLPALASLQQTIASTRSGLLGKKADLNAGIFNKAFDSTEQDRAVLADWNKMTAQQQFDASEADKQRAFTAQQNQADRASSAANAAASRGGGVDGKAIIGGIQSLFNSKKGKDGKVSPSTFQSGREQWVAAGGSPADYYDTFSGYINQNHVNDY